jgi:hypothetical protein
MIIFAEMGDRDARVAAMTSTLFDIAADDSADSREIRLEDTRDIIESAIDVVGAFQQRFDGRIAWFHFNFTRVLVCGERDPYNSVSIDYCRSNCRHRRAAVPAAPAAELDRANHLATSLLELDGAISVDASIPPPDPPGVEIRLCRQTEPPAAPAAAAAPACVICLERAREMLLQPCNHVVCCRACSYRVTTCPVCRSAVQSRTRVFIP